MLFIINPTMPWVESVKQLEALFLLSASWSTQEVVVTLMDLPPWGLEMFTLSSLLFGFFLCYCSSFLCRQLRQSHRHESQSAVKATTAPEMPTCWCIRSRKRRAQIPRGPTLTCQVINKAVLLPGFRKVLKGHSCHFTWWVFFAASLPSEVGRPRQPQIWGVVQWDGRHEETECG